MTDTAPIICKPTRWFIFRGVVMFVMFSVMAFLFFKDGSTGYRAKNEVFYLKKTFELADTEFRAKGGTLTPEQWRAHAATRSVAWPEDTSILPVGTPVPMPWPEILHQHDRMKSGQWRDLWREYSGSRGLPVDAPDDPYPAHKIRDQWIVFSICLTLALLAAFFLTRTLRRSMSADDEAVTDQRGRRVPYADLRVQDLRKWDTKGLAFIGYDGPSGKGTLRIDGLTYGGFKAEDDQPAERLMQRIKSRFSGEIIEFASVEDPPAEDETPAADESSTPPSDSKP